MTKHYQNAGEEDRKVGGVRHRLKSGFCLCQLGFSLVSRPSARRKVARVNACTIPRSG